MTAGRVGFPDVLAERREVAGTAEAGAGAETSLPFVFVTSALTPGALAEVHRRLGEFLGRRPEITAVDLALTLAQGREQFAERRAFIAADTGALGRYLRGDPPAEGDRVVEVGPAGDDGASVPKGWEAAAPESWQPAAAASARWCRGEGPAPTPGPGGRRIRIPGYPFEHERSAAAAVADEAEAAGRPLDPLEQRRLFHDLIRRGEGREYVVVAEAQTPVPEPFDRAALSAAFAELLLRHEELRVRFVLDGGSWRAVTSPPTDRPEEEGLLLVFDPPDPDAAGAAASAPFRLRGGPLVRLVAEVGDGLLRVRLAAYEPVAARVAMPDLARELLTTCLRPRAGRENEETR